MVDDLKTVHVVHHQIQDDQGIGIGHGHADCGHPSVRLLSGESLASQYAANDAPHRRIVVHHKYTVIFQDTPLL